MLKTEKNTSLSYQAFPKIVIFFTYGRVGSVFHMYIRLFFLLLLYVIWDQKEEMARKIVYFNGRNKDVENKTGIIYNDTVDQLKGCSAAW